MGDRRMFSRNIIESDAFLDLPNDCKVLYFYLNIAADDRGFVDNPRAVMRICSATDDAMKMLIAKKFVLLLHKNDSSIFLIKHWRIHNYIAKDRFKESKYIGLLQDIYFDENDAYSTNADNNTPCIQSVYSPCTKENKSKYKNNITEGNIEEGGMGGTSDLPSEEPWDPENPYRDTLAMCERIRAKREREGR